MGGAVGVGNMSPAAEFNILADPEAARIVLGNSREDLPVTIVCWRLNIMCWALQLI